MKSNVINGVYLQRRSRPGGPSLPPGLLEKTDKEQGPVDLQQNGFPLSALVRETAPQTVKQQGGEENNDHDGVNP